MESFTIDHLDLEDEDFNHFNLSYVDLIDYTETSNIYILYLFICLFGLVGNALAIYVILRYQKMRTVTNIYVLSLAVADLLHMICLLIDAIEVALSYWPLGGFMCRVYWTLLTWTKCSSIYFLVTLSISDCVLVYFPAFSNQRLGSKIAIGASSFVWALCLLLVIPLFRYSDMNEFYSCKIIWPEPIIFWSQIIISYQLSMTFALPFLIICICLILTIVRIKQQEKPTSSTIKQNLIMIVALYIVFIIFWLPVDVLETMKVYRNLEDLSDVMLYIVLLIPYLKSCLYPILYGFLSPGFKEAYKNVLLCRKGADTKSTQEISDGKQDAPSSNC
ncbi:somatostatin receptor type 5-like isoform X1 [Bombina bombina]|uniref:somatostatin receptor type 5-like isoform X1 n=1 Tax=Bombina bombina TaxID=8345 RepID=UPI00235AA744|nr:somatostatin receptor type 5-like isoform X1 [Bombina bombina]XP_053550777.1 somatostatin receptor type 5-like isoform X1 [Bombina bombina]XP_053550778.1 somatostatin receptor type 5-like isoform X1 [Bombina bombina]